MPTKTEEIAPWVPGAVARRIIGYQTILGFCLLLTTILLAIVAWKLATIPPRLVSQTADGLFTSLQTSQIKINADDVINFVQTVVPRLYDNSEGSAPGIEELRGLNVVNPNIIDGMLGDMQQNATQMKNGQYFQSAIVQDINRTTLAIHYSQKIVYCEANGVVILTDKEGHSQTTPTQWAMLIYIKDVLDNNATIVNRYGLYLQNIVPQNPGTVNSNVPKPTGEEFAPKTEGALPKTNQAPGSNDSSSPVPLNSAPETANNHPGRQTPHKNAPKK